MIVLVKAYKIETRAHEVGSWSVYGGETAGKAKATCIMALKNVYGRQAGFDWINYCHRAPEYDKLCNQYPGCVAWKHGNERWEAGRDSWYEGDRFPKENIEQI